MSAVCKAFINQALMWKIQTVERIGQWLILVVTIDDYTKDGEPEEV